MQTNETFAERIQKLGDILEFHFFAQKNIKCVKFWHENLMR